LTNFEALALLGELTLILDNAAKSGFERIDSDGERVFDFAYWRDECRRWSQSKANSSPLVGAATRRRDQCNFMLCR
jgi:hypothetical protein